MLEKARNNLQNIKNQDLSIIKSFKQPPAAIKFCLEAVAALITNKAVQTQWGDLQQVLGDKDFIKKVQTLKTEQISEKVNGFVVNNYTNTKEWDIGGFYKASSAVGPLSEW